MVVGIARIAPGPFLQSGTGGLSKKPGDRRIASIVGTALAPKIAANKTSPSASARPQLPSVTRKRGSIRYAVARPPWQHSRRAGEGSEAFLTLVKRAKIDGL